jgi:T5orf172 domain
MKPLGTHQSNFTWARNQYNKSDDPDAKVKYARYMAKYLNEGRNDGFSTEQITHGTDYLAEVDKDILVFGSENLPVITEEQAKREIAEAVDASDVIRIGEGGSAVYAYGYICCQDRLKVGYATGDTVQRIADQIGTSTPDRPVLYIEIKTDDCRAIERAIHAVLRVRGRKIAGGGDEWFRATRDEIIAIYRFICEPTSPPMAAS